ncbi:MAG: NUDIX hydrolase [Saccharospirillaceae bacterium]|nr:NUDIX hydrolase [Saccharospirillaceae bacterium]
MSSNYDMTKFKNPLFTVDSVLFTVQDEALKVLMVKRASEPFCGCWGLPGGFVDVERDASTDATALRKLYEKTNVEPRYLEQLSTFSGGERDPRGFSVTLVYYALIAAQAVSPHVETVDDAQWVTVQDLPSLEIAFDHLMIIEQAVMRLQQKTLYTMIPVFCLEAHFTVGQLKTVIEVIIDKPIQRKSLIRRIESSDMFISLDEKVKSGGRFAQLYKLKENVDVVKFTRNLNS